MTGSPPREPRRILLIQLRYLGDVVLTSALLEDLRGAFPEARLDFLVGPAAAPLLEHHPLIGETRIAEPGGTLRAWRDVRARRYDWIIDVQSSQRTALLALLSGARVRVGFDITGWGRLYTHRLPRSGRPVEYVLRERQRLLELAGVRPVATRPRLHLTEGEHAQGQEDARALGLHLGVRRVGILLSAGRPAKEWRIEAFAEVAGALAAEGNEVVIFQSPGDEEKVGRLRALTGVGVVAALPDLRRFLGMLAGCDLLISGDTGPVHMATALDVPTVTIFGPKLPDAWSPGLPTTVPILASGVPCLGCQLDVCPIGHDCMVRVTAPMVLQPARRLLASRPTAADAEAGR